MPARHSPAHRQSGTTLIEVLVTVMVLTLGVVAMANLQVSALKLGHGAYLRSQAVALSYQILDTMRANRADALSGRYDWSLGTPAPSALITGSSPQRDIQIWLWDIDRTLAPYRGVGGIERDVARFTVTIRWDDRYASERAGLGQQRFESFRVVADL